VIEALVYLAAAVVCVPLAARFRLGSVLGYLIAGAAIGPWGLALAGDVESTLHLAELGVVLMLFVIGLELDPRRLLGMRREVFGGGFLQLAISRRHSSRWALPGRRRWSPGWRSPFPRPRSPCRR
jgi:Kef-type K+ transport system membrane component KefB